MKLKKLKKRHKIITVILVLISFSMSASAAIYEGYNLPPLPYISSLIKPILYMSCSPNTSSNCIEPQIYYSGHLKVDLYQSEDNSYCYTKLNDDIGYYKNYTAFQGGTDGRYYSDCSFAFGKSLATCCMQRYPSQLGNWYHNGLIGLFSHDIYQYKTWVIINYLKKRNLKIYQPPKCIYLIIRGKKLDGNYDIDYIAGDNYGIEKEDILSAFNDLKYIPSLTQDEFDNLPKPYNAQRDYDKVFWKAKWIHPNCRNWVPFKDKNYSPIKNY